MERFRVTGGSDDDRWFRVGTLDVTTSVLVAGVTAVSIVLWVISKDIFVLPLVLDGAELRGGQIWRLVTWPLVNGPSIWTVISVAMIVLVGSELERMVGRDRMAWMIGAMTIIPALTAPLLETEPPIYGARFLVTGFFVVLVLHRPSARTFFDIPLWVMLVVFEGIFFLQLLDGQLYEWIAFEVASILVATLLARAFDLTEFHQIPKVPLPAFVTKDPYHKANRAREKAQRSQRRRGDNVVSMQNRSSSGLDRNEQSDMDRLLDKISASGIDSLTPPERQRLNELSRRLRDQ